MNDFYESKTYFLVVLTFTGLFIFFLRKEFNQIFFGYGVPFVPTGDDKVDIFIKNLELKPGDNFLDLGSGDGKILEAIAKRYKNLEGITITGIENSPYPYKLSIERKKKNNLNYNIEKSNFFKTDFSKYNVIYAYTITYLMGKIWRKIKKECREGTIFYTNSFKVPGENYIKKFKIANKDYIYVYKL